MAGLVRVDGEVKDKAGSPVSVNAAVEVTGAPHPYVSRGGLKLEKALTHFRFDMSGRVVIDVGASTGGFTDCALQHGAAHVYAVDVGYGQLAWKLRQDERVTVMERFNFRYATPALFTSKQPDTAVIDVSFISLEKILAPLKNILPDGGCVISLVKPQFEAGKEHVGKKGVIRDPDVHRLVLSHVLQMAESYGFQVQDLTFSPITGGKGNIEFLVYWKKQQEKLLTEDTIEKRIVETVNAAHRHFDSK